MRQRPNDLKEFERIRLQHAQARVFQLDRLRSTYGFLYNPVLILGLLSVSWFMSYSGVVAAASFMDAPSENTKRLALVVTLAAMGAQYALWHYAQRLIPEFVTHTARAVGVSVVAFLMLALFTSSTYTGFIGLSEQSAQQQHLIAVSEDIAVQIDGIEARVAEMENMLFVVLPQVEAACTRYEQELNSGVITGASGRGIVTGHFLRICTAKRSIADNLRDTIAANETRSNVLAGLVAEIDAVVYDTSQPMFERQRAFLQLSRTLGNELRAMRLDDRTSAVRTSFEALGNSVTALESDASGLQQSQAQAIAGIANEERESAAAMGRMIADIETKPIPQIERAKLLPAQVVVLKFFEMHLPNLALVVVIDGFPVLSMLLLWAAAMRDRRSTSTNL